MKSAEMSNDSTMNIYGQRRSNRPSVAAKMSQLANDSGDISYDSVLRIVGDEIDAEKKSKMLLRTSLMLLFSLLALTAANAGLTFAVVEFAKETSVSGDVMTVKGTDQVVKTSSADFQLIDGRMMTAGAAPAPIATVSDELDGVPAEDLLFAAKMDLSVLSQVDSLDLESETGAVRSFKITGHEFDEEMTAVTFHTASGIDITVDGDGDVEINDVDNSRRLGKKNIEVAKEALLEDPPEYVCQTSGDYTGLRVPNVKGSLTTRKAVDELREERKDFVDNLRHYLSPDILRGRNELPEVDPERFDSAESFADAVNVMEKLPSQKMSKLMRSVTACEDLDNFNANVDIASCLYSKNAKAAIKAAAWKFASDKVYGKASENRCRKKLQRMGWTFTYRYMDVDDIELKDAPELKGRERQEAAKNLEKFKRMIRDENARQSRELYGGNGGLWEDGVIYNSKYVEHMLNKEHKVYNKDTEEWETVGWQRWDNEDEAFVEIAAKDFEGRHDETSRPLKYKHQQLFFRWRKRMQTNYWRRRILSLNTRFIGWGSDESGDDEAVAKNVVVKAAQLPAPAAANKENVGAMFFDFQKSSLKIDSSGRWTGGGSGDRRHLSAMSVLSYADAYVYEPFTQKYGYGSGSGSRFLYQYQMRPEPIPMQIRENSPLAPAYVCDAYPLGEANGYTCNNVDAFSYMSYDDLGVTNNPAGNNWLCDMWGYSNGGRNFVLQTTTNSVTFVEVTDPNNPYVVGTHQLDGFDYQWFWSGFPKFNIISDVKVLGDNGYFVSWRYKSSVTKMDLTQLLTASPGTDFVHDTHVTGYRACCHYNFFGKWLKYLAAHNIVAFGNLILGLWVSPTYVGFNYACTAGDGGVMILDAYDPANQVGCISEHGWTGWGGNGKNQFVGAPHDAACHDYGKNQVCFLAGGYSGKLSAVDVTNMILGKYYVDVGTYTRPDGKKNTIYGSGVTVRHQTKVDGHKRDWTCKWSRTGKCSDMVHQVAVHDKGTFMVITDEFDEVNSKIFGGKDANGNYSNGYNMRLRTYAYTTGGGFVHKKTVDTGRSETRDHQGYFYGNYYFLAAVRAGVIFYHVNRSTGGMSEVGFYDTHPDNQSLSQFGAWTVFAFPYTKCGATHYVTAVADMAGLHLVQPTFTQTDMHCNIDAIPAPYRK